MRARSKKRSMLRDSLLLEQADADPLAEHSVGGLSPLERARITESRKSSSGPAMVQSAANSARVSPQEKRSDLELCASDGRGTAMIE